MTADEAADPFIVLAVIGRPHGIRGAVRARLFSDSELLFESDTLEIRLADGSVRTTHVLGSHPAGNGMVVLELEGVTGRTDAESLKGLPMGVPRAALPALDPDEFYLADLPGMSVVNEAGETLGVVQEVMSYPTVECVLVRVKGRPIEIPLVEPWLVDVDSVARVIRVGELDDLSDSGTGAR